jgi:Flp pilus assembly protein TadG
MRDFDRLRVAMFDQHESTIAWRLLPYLLRLQERARAGASLLLRQFARQRNASSTVEFGLLAAPFIALTIGIIQTAMVFFASQTLETAAAAAGRLVLTGQAQIAGWNAAQFKSQVCSQIYGIINCQSSLYVDVETYSSFAAVGLGMPISNGTFNSGTLGYNPGGPGDIVVVRLYYQFPLYVKLLGLNMSNLTNGSDLLAATAVFKNEPYASS